MKTDYMKLNILVSSYACGPNWGSEIGMGWNWVIALSRHCQLTVITELGFKVDIESALVDLNLKHKPKFHYIDVGDNARALFWKQGDWRFYKSYKIWQKKAFSLAKDLVNTNQL